MRDETYGISIIGLAAGLYGILAWIGMIHATVSGAPVSEQASNIHSNEEIVAVIAKR